MIAEELFNLVNQLIKGTGFRIALFSTQHKNKQIDNVRKQKYT